MAKRKIIIIISLIVVLFTSGLFVAYEYSNKPFNIKADKVSSITIVYLVPLEEGLSTYELRRLPNNKIDELVNDLNKITHRKIMIRSAFIPDDNNACISIHYSNGRTELIKLSEYYRYYPSGGQQIYYPYELDTEQYRDLLETYFPQSVSINQLNAT